MFPTWRKPTVIVVSLLAIAVAVVAWYVDVRTAVYVLAAGCLGAALLRAFARERDVLTARGRAFDVTVLLLLAIGLALLAPWGLATVPS